jgi:hypothetical protein
MEILLVGTNESIDKKRADNEPTSKLLNEILKETFGPPPGYDRALEVDSNVFLAKFIVPIKDMYPAEALVEAFPHLGPVPSGHADDGKPDSVSITLPSGKHPEVEREVLKHMGADDPSQ